jgi:hypothetical protein
MLQVAMTSLFIAMKVEEEIGQRTLTSLLNTFNHMYQKRRGVKVCPLDLGSDRYRRWRDNVIATEREVLACLGFGIYSVIEHPHSFILYYVKFLEPSAGSYNFLAQYAWNCLNDVLRLDISVTYDAKSLACAAIYVAARMIDIMLPESPPWWRVFDGDIDDMEAISVALMELYDSGGGQLKESWLPSLKGGDDVDSKDDVKVDDK